MLQLIPVFIDTKYKMGNFHLKLCEIKYSTQKYALNGN